HVREPYGYANAVAGFLDAAVQDGIYLQLLTSLNRVLLWIGIFPDGADRPDDDLFEILEMGDERFGHSHLERFVAAFIIQWFERQHGNRLDRSRPLAIKPPVEAI